MHKSSEYIPHNLISTHASNRQIQKRENFLSRVMLACVVERNKICITRKPYRKRSWSYFIYGVKIYTHKSTSLWLCFVDCRMCDSINDFIHINSMWISRIIYSIFKHTKNFSFFANNISNELENLITTKIHSWSLVTLKAHSSSASCAEK